MQRTYACACGRLVKGKAKCAECRAPRSTNRYPHHYRQARAERLTLNPYCQWHEQIGQKVPATMADHYIPVAHGGSHDITNLVSSCQSCNLTRGTTPPGEWLDTLRKKNGIT